MKKVIRLLKDRNCHWYVVPNINLRELMIRRLAVKYGYNRVVTWNDVNGFGFAMSTVAWVRAGKLS